MILFFPPVQAFQEKAPLREEGDDTTGWGFFYVVIVQFVVRIVLVDVFVFRVKSVATRGLMCWKRVI